MPNQLADIQWTIRFAANVFAAVFGLVLPVLQGVTGNLLTPFAHKHWKRFFAWVAKFQNHQVATESKSPQNAKKLDAWRAVISIQGNPSNILSRKIDASFEMLVGIVYAVFGILLHAVAATNFDPIEKMIGGSTGAFVLVAVVIIAQIAWLWLLIRAISQIPRAMDNYLISIQAENRETAARLFCKMHQPTHKDGLREFYSSWDSKYFEVTPEENEEAPLIIPEGFQVDGGCIVPRVVKIAA